ncbi:hypothetical protein [Burkholderia cepacia]|uniref:hypothetical protein n=1 Tax=Burkholderia cepacia TaxID=292 RepID=UPI002AB5FA06|nr:hypothetical protein [Burkholderia cepacia]
MTRPAGSRNIQPIHERSSISTTSSNEIKHLANSSESSPLNEFTTLLQHQRNFLNWIDSRHEQLLEARRNAGQKGPKDAVYRKYRWYSEQQLLLEAVNAFEVFYKRTFIALAEPLRRYVPPEKIKGTVDAKTLWASGRHGSLIALIFEHQLYHDLEQVDNIANMLVGQRRYKVSDLRSPLRKRVRALQCVFQVRHTLSHNQGYVTVSDSAKFKILGFSAKSGEVIDPAKDHLGDVIRDLLIDEAKQFTEWLLESTASHLKTYSDDRNELLPLRLKERIEQSVGNHHLIDALDWDV